MGEYDCRKCSKSFRSERALKFHMESHDEDASMAAWNERRERSRSRIRELRYRWETYIYRPILLILSTFTEMTV